MHVCAHNLYTDINAWSLQNFLSLFKNEVEEQLGLSFDNMKPKPISHDALNLFKV